MDDKEILDQLDIHRAIFSVSPIGVAVYDHTGQCYMANPRVAEIIGAKSVEEVVAQNFHDIQSWKSSGLYEAALSSLDGKEIVRHTSHVVTTFKKDIWFESTLKPFVVDSKKHLLLIINDISKTKEIEFSLRDSNKLINYANNLFEEKWHCSSYREVSELCLNKSIELSGSSFGFMLEIDDNGKFNTMAITDPGWAACSLPDTKSAHLLVDIDIRGLWSVALKEGKPFVTNAPLSHKDSRGVPEGHPNITSFLGIPIIYEGETKWLIALANKEGGYDENDLRLMVQLSKTILEVLLRLKSEFKLIKTLEELGKSNKRLDDFAYIASHDLKEPLRAISNYASFLKEDYASKLDGEAQRFVDTIIKQSKRLEIQIGSLLHYSRIGVQALRFGPVDIGGLLRGIIGRYGYHKEENIDIEVQKDIPIVDCDLGFIEEIFTNLITNAIKYNDKDKKKIKIGCIEGKQLAPDVFYVKDNGVGINESNLDNIFTVFKRLYDRDEFGGGTGVGLTIAKKLVELHGGRIWVESEEAKGTTFYFTLGE